MMAAPPLCAESSAHFPYLVGMLTSIGANKKVYQPSTNEINEMYSKMFRGKGGSEGAAEAGPSTPGPSGAPGPSYA